MPLPKPVQAIILLFFFLLMQQAKAQTVAGKGLYLFEDSAKKLSAENALQLFQQQKFSHAGSNELNVGFTRSVFWIAYQNETALPPDSLLLYIGHHHINRIHFFFAGDSIVSQQWLTGDYYPFSQRPIDATGFYFPVNKKGLYLARVDKSNESLQLSFALVSRTEAIAAENNDKLVMALFTGMIMLLVLFGLFLFTVSKDRVYVYYVLYITSGWLWVLANSGYGFQYLWPGMPWFASKARPVFALAPLIFSMLFLGHYIGGIRSRKVSLTVKLMNCLLFACIVTILLFNEQGYRHDWWLYIQYLIPLISLGFVLVTLAILVTASLRGNKMAMFYLAAIFTLFIFAILQVSFSLGSLSSFGSFFNSYGLSVGFIMEAIILTAGLVYRFNQYRMDKEKLLTQLNREQQENTRILVEVQQAERSQVADQLHDVAGSLLSAAKLNLSSLREKELVTGKQAGYHLQKTEEAVSMVSDMVRNLSHALSPVMLEKVGLKTSLEKMTAIVNASGKINIRLLVIGFENYKAALNNHYTALYGIIYELLNNVVKHSGAKNVLLQVTEHEDCFSLIAEDDGIGMDPADAGGKPTLGIGGIRSKIDFFKGAIALDKNKPTGLIVTIEIPVKHET
jgi:two-component system, sensor histidine kinase LadS